jgi:hypothetical protein
MDRGSSLIRSSFAEVLAFPFWNRTVAGIVVSLKVPSLQLILLEEFNCNLALVKGVFPLTQKVFV